MSVAFSPWSWRSCHLSRLERLISRSFTGHGGSSASHSVSWLPAKRSTYSDEIPAAF